MEEISTLNKGRHERHESDHDHDTKNNAQTNTKQQDSSKPDQQANEDSISRSNSEQHFSVRNGILNHKSRKFTNSINQLNDPNNPDVTFRLITTISH